MSHLVGEDFNHYPLWLSPRGRCENEKWVCVLNINTQKGEGGLSGRNKGWNEIQTKGRTQCIHVQFLCNFRLVAMSAVQPIHFCAPCNKTFVSSGQLQRGATAFQLCVAEGPLLCFIQLYDLPERGRQQCYRPLYPPWQRKHARWQCSSHM